MARHIFVYYLTVLFIFWRKEWLSPPRREEREGFFFHFYKVHQANNQHLLNKYIVLEIEFEHELFLDIRGWNQSTAR